MISERQSCSRSYWELSKRKVSRILQAPGAHNKAVPINQRRGVHSPPAHWYVLRVSQQPCTQLYNPAALQPAVGAGGAHCSPIAAAHAQVCPWQSHPTVLGATGAPHCVPALPSQPFAPPSLAPEQVARNIQIICEECACVSECISLYVSKHALSRKAAEASKCYTM